MKSSIFKISIITTLVLVLIGISQVTAFNVGSFYPSNAPSSDIPTVYNSSDTQIINGKLGLGYSELDPPVYTGLNIQGGLATMGATVTGSTSISGKLRIAPVSTSAGITAINDNDTALTGTGLPSGNHAVSVSGGHIVYAAKKPSTTRVLCTYDLSPTQQGVIAPCRDDSAPENIVVEPTGTNAADARFPSSKGVSVAQSSIQGNTAALWGQIATGGSISNTCHSGSWGSTSPFNLSTTAITCP